MISYYDGVRGKEAQNVKRETYLKPILLKFMVAIELFMDGKFFGGCFVFFFSVDPVTVESIKVQTWSEKVVVVDGL